MKSRSLCLLCAAPIFLLTSAASHSLRSATSADEDRPATQTDSSESQPRAPKKSAGRLPDYFEKVGIGQSQRERIYAIQAAYKDEIEKFKAQLAAVESKRDAEIHALLTDRQKKEYARFVEAAKRRQAERKEQTEKP